MNVRDHSITFTLEGIRPEDAQGRILGYNIIYFSRNEPNVSINTMETDTNTTRITLNNLKEGSTYVIAVAGFTRKGTGKYQYTAVTCKFFNYVLKSLKWLKFGFQGRCYDSLLIVILLKERYGEKICEQSLNKKK